MWCMPSATKPANDSKLPRVAFGFRTLLDAPVAAVEQERLRARGGHEHRTALAVSRDDAGDAAMRGVGGGEQAIVDVEPANRGGAAQRTQQHRVAPVTVLVELRRGAIDDLAGLTIGPHLHRAFGELLDLGPAAPHFPPGEALVVVGVEIELAVEVAKRDVDTLLDARAFDVPGEVRIAGLVGRCVAAQHEASSEHGGGAPATPGWHMSARAHRRLLPRYAGVHCCTPRMAAARRTSDQPASRTSVFTGSAALASPAATAARTSSSASAGSF